MLYIGLIIKVTDLVHMMHIQKNLLTNIMLVQYKFPDSTISGSNITYDKYIRTSGSLILFLQDILYGDKDLPEGVIPHLLNVDEKYWTSLCMVLYKYHDIFPGTLPTQAPPNWKLGDVHKIPLEEGAEPV